jgi:ABC-2 type transport system permease protein
MSSRHHAPAQHERPRIWAIVLERELRDLWAGGRALVMCLAFSLLLSVIAYLVATNTDLNFLEQRESVSLTLQVATAVGALLALLVAGDSISGERERGTLETLLLTPAPRGQVATGKLLAALSLWLASFVVTVPYVWRLGSGVGIVAEALAVGLVVGTLLAVFLASLGILISVFSSSNRLSLSVGLFVLLALFAPSQLPSSAEQGWAGNLLMRFNPVTAGEHFVGRIVINGHSWSEDLSWLVSPVVAALVFAIAAPLAARRFVSLHGGVSG